MNVCTRRHGDDTRLSISPATSIPMAELETLVFWVGAAVLALGALGFAAGGLRRARDETRKYYGAMALAAGAAAGGYTAMAVGVGATTVAIDGTPRTVYWLRYVAWLAVGTLVLVALWWLADSDGGTLAALVGSDALAVLAGAGAGLIAGSLVGLGVVESRLALLGLAALALLGLLGVLFRRLSPQAGFQPGEVGVLFSIVRNVVVLVWLLYLAAWAVGPVLGVLGAGAAALAFLVLDIAATLGVGALLLRNDATLARA